MTLALENVSGRSSRRSNATRLLGQRLQRDAVRFAEGRASARATLQEPAPRQGRNHCVADSGRLASTHMCAHSSQHGGTVTSGRGVPSCSRGLFGQSPGHPSGPSGTGIRAALFANAQNLRRRWHKVMSGPASSAPSGPASHFSAQATEWTREQNHLACWRRGHYLVHRGILWLALSAHGRSELPQNCTAR